MTKVSRITQFQALEQLWFYLRSPDFTELERANGDPIWVQRHHVVSIRPSGVPENSRIVLIEQGEIILGESVAVVVAKLEAKPIRPANFLPIPQP